jgi:hypothetical protein
LALGIAGTAAGAGAASALLAKAGLDAAAAAAVVVLVTGVVLLAWGAATLIRAIPGWWRLLAVPIAMAVLWFVLLSLTVALNATSRPPGPLGPATPAGRSLTSPPPPAGSGPPRPPPCRCGWCRTPSTPRA